MLLPFLRNLFVRWALLISKLRLKAKKLLKDLSLKKLLRSRSYRRSLPFFSILRFKLLHYVPKSKEQHFLVKH